ncbi:hypothetical protein [Streptomyces sp. NPDC048357]
MTLRIQEAAEQIHAHPPAGVATVTEPPSPGRADPGAEGWW